MIKSQLRLYPYHTFLTVPFIVLFLYAYNLGQTHPSMTYRTLLIGELATVIFFGGFYLLFRDRLKTGAYVTIILFALFQYGVLYNIADTMFYMGWWPLKNVHRYLVLLYLLAFTLIAWLIRRSKRDFIRLNYFLNFLLFLLIVFNLVRINFSDLSSRAQRKALQKTRPAQKIVFNDSVPKPDVFYIILDGYANNAVLRKDYRYDNSAFADALTKLGFTLRDSAVANYYFTTQSLSATLNMNFPDTLSHSNHLLYDNQVFRTFKENGYRVYHLYSGYAVTSSFVSADSTVYIDGPQEFEKTILRYTILRLDDLFGNFAYTRLTSQFKKMHILARLSTHPKFCFLHFVAPHPPYIFMPDGSKRAKHQFSENSWDSHEFYIDQLGYVNKQITGLLAEIRKINPGATIVLQSDHGPWMSGKTKEDVFNARSKILYAYHSDRPLNIPDTTSSVNTFRYVFNGLFKCGLPILPNKAAGKEAVMKDPLLLNMVREN